jgi:integrase
LKRKRVPNVWEWRYSDRSQPGSPLTAMTFSTDTYPTKAAMWKHIDGLLWKVNADTPQNVSQELSFGGLCDRFIQDEHLLELDQLKAGQQNTFGNLKVSTARSYLNIIEKHLRPKFGVMTMSTITAAVVHEWFRELTHSPLTKAHIKAVFFCLFEKAMLWEVITVQRNPMELVEIKGSTKRRKKPLVLSPEECLLVLNALSQPHRTMVLVAVCMGLRVSEILALKWEDFDFEKLCVRVSRAVVRGIVDSVKTAYSEDDLPLDPEFAAALLEWKKQCPSSADGWVFPSPITGRPYEPGNAQQKVIRKVGDKLGIHNLGWHSFRHSYRSLLDAVGASVGVQQKLMRHAQVSTTMNIYGDAFMESKREANSKAVKMLKGQESDGSVQTNLVVFGFPDSPRAVANAS